MPNITPPPQEKSNIGAAQQDIDVMPQVKKERGDAGRMSVQDIIKHDLEQSGSDIPFEKVYYALYQMIQSGRTRIMRSGNTLFAYNILEPGVAEFHVINADAPKNLLKNVKEFYEAMKKANFKRGISTTENPQIVKLAQTAGIPITAKQSQRFDGKQMVPTIEVTVEIQ